MKFQIRYTNGAIKNVEIEDSVTLMENLQENGVDKISFDLLDARLALYPNDASFAYFGGIFNFPNSGD